MNTYTIGAAAYLDTFRGLVPCKTAKLHTTEAHGVKFVEVSAVVTKTVGAYSKGETVTLCHSHVVPVKQVVRRGFGYRIKTDFEWVPKSV